ncbi:GPI transamidase component PIG-U [Aspergillus bombycis]|uniref:GPI transamidase component PIG-U n=1 Tax=Aspergillus bombycis TaxID=109264 RepID=A0A1F8A6Q9_9EURO|nr:GPI transamidase component PIG-U [Aspergillus bombycis]OGM47069.1 GPI transamidase component PIG-U [Aspergillus bombycis]
MTRPGTKYRHFCMTKPSVPGRQRNVSLDSPNTTFLSSHLHSSEITQGKPNEEQLGKPGVPGFVSTSPKISPGTDKGWIVPSTSSFTIAAHYLEVLYASYSHYKDLIFNYLDRSRSFVIPRPLLFELFSTLYDDIKAGVDLYAGLTQNTRKSLPPISVNTTVEEFCGWFRGVNLRWELLGVVFALAGLASVHTAEPQKPLGYESFATNMYTASRACIEICEEFNQLNDMTTWMRHTNVALASNVFGDTSSILYRCFSSLTAELFTLRYHRQISLQSDVPFFMSETRKRLFAAAVCRDMNLATLLERPPFIDCNFCDIIYPLDLDEEEIVLVGSELNAALEKLDEDGWKISFEREKLLRPATGIRIRFALSSLRAKILRLSLGNRRECMTKQHLELYQEYENIWARVPMQYRYRSDVWDYLSPRSCVVLLSAHLDHLHCGFQILRMLQQEGQDTLTTILDTSMRLLSGMLDLMKQQERFIELRERFTWIFLFYGLPGAGTLATELHQHTLKGLPLPSSIPCSRIVRDLSVAISWVEKQNSRNRSDYQLCLQISKVISRLLDDTLNQGLISARDTNSQLEKVQPEQQVAEGFHIDRSSDGSDESQSLPEPFTSEDFLNWIDDLVWDGQTNISMGF